MYSGTIQVLLVHAEDLVPADKDTSDPYVLFKVPGGKEVKSKVIKKTLNPAWKTIYSIPVSMPMSMI